MAFSQCIVASQVYVWMQYYGKLNQTLEANIVTVLDDLKTAGYNAIEGWLHWFEDPAQGKRILNELRARDMQLIAVYYGARYHEPELSGPAIERALRLLDNAQASGCAMLNSNPDPIDWSQPLNKTDDQLKLQCEALNRLGEALTARGVTLTVHNHDAEMRNNAHEFYADLEHTDPRYVFFCLDFDWIAHGGQSPEALLKATGTRLRSTHLRNSRANVWLEAFGDGDTDYRRLALILAEQDYSGTLIVELAYADSTRITRPLAENMRISREYVRTIFGV